MIHTIKNNNNYVELRSNIMKRDQGTCCKCHQRGTIIRSGKDFDYIGYFTGTSKPWVNSFITVCAKCNARMDAEARGDGKKYPYVRITDEGEIIECR